MPVCAKSETREISQWKKCGPAQQTTTRTSSSSIHLRLPRAVVVQCNSKQKQDETRQEDKANKHCIGEIAQQEVGGRNARRNEWNAQCLAMAHLTGTGTDDIKQQQQFAFNPWMMAIGIMERETNKAKRKKE